MKAQVLFVSMLLLCGCAAKPVPLWVASGQQQLETYKESFLSGREPRIAEVYFRRAIEEIKRGGDTDLLGKLWLTRMALQVAVLEPPEEGGYSTTEAAGIVAENRNYLLFLKGERALVDPSRLPARYAAFWPALGTGDRRTVAAAIATIEDPLSRLIAAGVAVRDRLENETILSLAVDTAAGQGWKRALIAWLGRLKRHYESRGETGQAAMIGSRIDLIR